MGGTEKTFLTLGGVTMLERVARSIAPQCDSILVSANGDPARFSAHGFAMITDAQSCGPMAALAGAMDWFALGDSAVTHILSVPGDTPFLPSDLVARLAAALKPDTLAACAASGERLHPVIGLWPLEARKTLSNAVAAGTLGFRDALQGHKVEKVEWASEPCDPFFNVNTPQDLVRAEAMVST